MNMYCLGCLFCSLLFFSSCKNKESHFYKLENISVSENKNNELFINEYYVVSNPPSNKENLLRKIKKFNDSIFISDLSKQDKIWRKQTFYKETEDLNKNFKEKDPNLSGYFEKVDIAHYYKSMLFIGKWSISERVVGYYTIYMGDITGKTTHFVYPDKLNALKQIGESNSINPR